MKIQKNLRRGILLLISMMIVPVLSNAGSCSSKLFTVTIDSSLTIGDAIENLADTCNMTVIVKDEWAKKKLDKRLYFVKLKNTTLNNFLNTILRDNDLHYRLDGDKLSISYLTTRTFRIHYITGTRTGESSSAVTISNSQGSGGISQAGGGGGGTDQGTKMTIKNSDEFIFWKTVENEVQRILIGAADDGIHYTRAGDSWIGPDGKKWEYNPLAPIVNSVVGMITVTGTDKQLARVSKYITTLKKQLKTQVLIDVRILTVTFDNSSTTGVDWSQLYGLQNLAINTMAMGQENISSYTLDETGMGAMEFAPNTRPTSAGIVDVRGSMEVQDVVKFLATQGDVKAVSSPRVMTLNNQPAMISVGKDLYYKIRSNVVLPGGSGGTTAATQSEQIDSVFAGVLLDITPEIDHKGFITLKINPSITNTLEPISSQATARDIPPDMIKRQLSSVIKVKDGHHAILGGLITSETGTKINKVPLLGDLPLFEYAFKHEEKIEKVIELVIIVTPHVINNSKDVSLRDLGYKRVNGQ
ncbi:MAG: secretin N-terminal domain-containing protein [Campylobacterota bacterium]|nr:secretin N-terminal domain-containing protein [Campylobacterota bacterium]